MVFGSGGLALKMKLFRAFHTNQSTVTTSSFSEQEQVLDGLRMGVAERANRVRLDEVSLDPPSPILFDYFLGAAQARLKGRAWAMQVFELEKLPKLVSLWVLTLDPHLSKQVPEKLSEQYFL